jgi:hypothetical protein
MDHERTAQRNDADRRRTRTLLVITGLLLVGIGIECCVCVGFALQQAAEQRGEGCPLHLPLLQRCDSTSWNDCLCWWFWEEPVPVFNTRDFL